MTPLVRNKIFKDAPWLKPGRSTSYAICGDDLDALLSTAMFMKFHPRSRLGGMYAGFRNLMIAKDAMGKRAPLIWVDLDLAVTGSRCLGHHVLRPRRKDPSPIHPPGLNLNDFRDVTMSRFQDKYPLGTVHFLVWLYQLPVPRHSLLESLVWLCDSAFINGQSHRYRSNVRAWLDLMPHPDLERGFERLDTRGFEEQMSHAIQELTRLGLKGGRVQTRSAHLALTAHPIHLSPYDIGPFTSFCRWVGASTGLPDILENRVEGEALTWQGVRNREAVGTLLGAKSLKSFLKGEKVFSYALPGMGEMNYTRGIGGNGLEKRIKG